VLSNPRPKVESGVAYKKNV